MKVTVLGRPGCHLCEEALAELKTYLGSRSETGDPVEVEEINIETDDNLHRLYLERIPVIMVEDRIVSEIWFEEDAFEAALEGLPGGSG